MEKKLIDKAREYGRQIDHNRIATDEEVELALAWAHDEVSLTQVAVAVGQKQNSNFNKAYLVIARGLMRVIKDNGL